MNDKDTRSLKVVEDWNADTYQDESRSNAALQVLINAALEEQADLIKVACADAVFPVYGKRAADICLGVKVV